MPFDLSKKVTPLRAIRFKCIDCCCGQVNEVRLCTCVECPLYPFRMGHSPHKNELSNEGEEICNDDELEENTPDFLGVNEE